MALGKPARRIAAIAALALTVVAAPAAAQQSTWQAETLDPGRAVTALRQVDGDVFVEAGRWYRAVPCNDGVCLEAGRPPADRPARDGIPGGMVATAPGPGIAGAWYVEPTDRYDHGILGDRIEAGGLTVVDNRFNQATVSLDETEVFEDLTPRIADIDGDGRNDVVVIRTTIGVGAAIAVYGFDADGTFGELAAIAPIGLTHRWLNIAGIADFNGDGRLDIALVKTPHIGGRLEFWTMQGGELRLLAAAEGFSNHAIGSTELGMSAIADVTGDGIADLALPDAGRTVLRIVSLTGGGIRDVAAVPLGSPVVTAIGTLAVEGRPVFLAGLADGRLMLVRPQS